MTLPLMVENLYENVAAINLSLYQQPDPRNSGVWRSRPITMGFGKGRFEDESDEDVEAWVESLRRLRDE